MHRFEVIGRVVSFPAGCVMLLSADQHRRRRHLVEVLAENQGPEKDMLRVRATGPLQFKAGETVSVIADSGINKTHLSELAPPEAVLEAAAAESGKKAGKKKAAAAGKAKG